MTLERKRELASPRGEKPLLAPTFKNSLRLWQAQWKARRERANEGDTDQEAGCQSAGGDDGSW
jgi:hypothetical protein